MKKVDPGHLCRVHPGRFSVGNINRVVVRDGESNKETEGQAGWASIWRETETGLVDFRLQIS